MKFFKVFRVFFFLFAFGIVLSQAQTAPVTTIPVATNNATGDTGTYLAANNARHEVYVANANNLVVIDTALWQVKHTFPLANFPIAACVYPATSEVMTINVIAITGGYEATLTFTDPDSGAFRSIKNPGGFTSPAGSCAFSPDGKTLYLGNSDFGQGIIIKNRVVAIDTATWQMVKSWPTDTTDKFPVQQVAYYNGNVYAITNIQIGATLFGNLWVFNDSGYRKMDTQAIQPKSMAVSPNGVLYVSGYALTGKFQVPMEVTIDTATNLPTGSMGEIAPAFYAWGNSPWVAHVSWSTGFGSIELPSGHYVFDTGGVDPDIANYGLVALSNADGSDTLVILRDQNVAVYKVTPPSPTIYNAANAATSPFDSVTAGSLALVNGHGLKEDSTFQVDGGNAPLVVPLSHEQVYIHIPDSVPAGRHNFTVANEQTTSPLQLLVTVAQNLKLFLAYNGKPLALNSMGYPVSTAKPGEQITLLGTGGGSALAAFDAANPFSPCPLATTPAVTIDGQAINPDYTGKWGYPYLDIIRLTIPSGLASGAHDLTIGTTPYKGGIVLAP